MRISGWSADVCSSYLTDVHETLDGHRHLAPARAFDLELRLDHLTETSRLLAGQALHASVRAQAGHRERSEERRVGKVCASTCRSRLSPYLDKNTHINISYYTQT